MNDESIIGKKIPVLDHGFVRLVRYMGSDLSILEAARVSTNNHGKEHSPEDDRRLINYLMLNKHWSPFEQTAFTWHLKLPIFVARQLMRHHWSWNEYSARYSPVIDDMFVPENFRVQGQRNHQGSGKDIENDMNTDIIANISLIYAEDKLMYAEMLEKGVAKELARIHMPVANYTELYGTTNLRNLFIFLSLRLHEHAQAEIKVYAEAMYTILAQLGEFVYSTEAFWEHTKIDWQVQKLENQLKGRPGFFLSALQAIGEDNG